MTGKRMTFRLSAAALLVAVVSPAATAVKIGDITHLQGSRVNRLVGYGLVVGLNGTGDGGNYIPAMQALAKAHERFANPVVALDELKSVKNVAIVLVEASLPRDGAREGERVDVQVSSIGAAKSLLGGRLLITPLVGPHPQDTRGAMALASGPLHIENAELPTVAKIVQGAQLEQDWIHNYIALGRELAVARHFGGNQNLSWIRPDEPYVTLVIDESVASWGVANTVAQAINADVAISAGAADDASSQIAMACDPRTVAVRLPEAERNDPAAFLARLEILDLFMQFAEARVTVNRRTGTIVMTGDVEIAPAVISHKGLTVETLMPERVPTMENPKLVKQEFIGLDPGHKGGAKLADLLDALNRLQVPAPDKIAIIDQLKKTGKLYATVVEEQ
ncbi:MAG: flagellar basal body P-ring protein FlgI [Planctomycetes bacterium]|nr:flagellar basal body P-ring protein FlgI [Planctomycetota bacterium]